MMKQRYPSTRPPPSLPPPSPTPPFTLLSFFPRFQFPPYPPVFRLHFLNLFHFSVTFLFFLFHSLNPFTNNCPSFPPRLSFFIFLICVLIFLSLLRPFIRLPLTSAMFFFRVRPTIKLYTSRFVLSSIFLHLFIFSPSVSGKLPRDRKQDNQMTSSVT